METDSHEEERIDKEFNLSEKIVAWPKITTHGFRKSDVKEFIKKLKEDMTKLGGIGHEMIIDKLSGDALI